MQAAPVTLLKKRLWHRVFLWILRKFCEQISCWIPPVAGSALKNWDKSFFSLLTVEIKKDRKDKLPKALTYLDHFKEKCLMLVETPKCNQITKRRLVKSSVHSMFFQNEWAKLSQIYLLCLAYILNQLLIILLNFVNIVRNFSGKLFKK